MFHPAAGGDPSKMAKRRHQISSLYHYTKQKELEQLEVRAAGSKTKAETQRKYGW
jgi:proline-rich protein PRCC